MKKIFILAFVYILLLTGCSFSPKTMDNGVDINRIKEERDNLQQEVDSYNKIYDDSLSDTINQYCEHYLTFDGKVTEKNVKQLKNFLTDDYFKELYEKPFNEGSAKESAYYQSTAVDELFYGNIADQLKRAGTINNVDVIAFCYQNITTDEQSTSDSVLYKFNLQLQETRWKISSVESF